MSKETDELLEKSFRAGPIGPYIDPEQSDADDATSVQHNIAQDLSPLVVDLNSSRRGDLDESFLRMFGAGIRAIMDRMFGGASLPVTVRGTPSQIKSFGDVLSKEKRYLETWSELGLDDPKTYKNKYVLDNAIRRFERTTGIPYPFK